MAHVDVDYLGLAWLKKKKKKEKKKEKKEKKERKSSVFTFHFFYSLFKS